MRKGLLILVLTVAMGGWANDAIERITSSAPGEGRVVIHQSEALAAAVAPPNEGLASVTGYRVQVYAGNQQSRSKKEAQDRQLLVAVDFPTVNSYITFKSPFWRLRMGNFIRFEEAESLLRAMQKKGYPFAKEMYVIKDDIQQEQE